MENFEIVESPPVVEIVTVSMGYCQTISQLHTMELPAALTFLQKLLPALYLKGALLPRIEPSDESANERFVTEEEYETLRVRLANYFGERDYFSTVDAHIDEVNSLPVSLAELLADIYLDLQDFMLLYAKESTAAKENAVANCAYYFQTGWGARITHALPYIHYLLAAAARTEA